MPQREYIKFLYEEEELSLEEISNRVGISWRTAAKYAKKEDWNQEPKTRRRRQPVMEPVAEVVDMWLAEDMLKPRKDRRTATAIYWHLKKEYAFLGSGRTVRKYVAERKKELKGREKFLDLDHPLAHAQADFGTTWVVFKGELKEIKCLVVSFPYSNAGFCVPIPSENTECFLHGRIQVFEWAGGVPQRIRFDNLAAAVIAVGKGEERKLTQALTRFMLHYRFKPEFCNSGRATKRAMWRTRWAIRTATGCYPTRRFQATKSWHRNFTGGRKRI